MSYSSRIEIWPASTLENVELLRPIMEDSVRHPLTEEIIHEEINENLLAIANSLQPDSDRYFAIAYLDNSAVGSMGLQPPIVELRQLATTNNPVELINAYVSKASRGLGIGRLLVRHLEDKARGDGYTELLLNSGPRYSRSGWPFWREMYGTPYAVLKNHYGPGLDANVWQTTLLDPMPRHIATQTP